MGTSSKAKADSSKLAGKSGTVLAKPRRTKAARTSAPQIGKKYTEEEIKKAQEGSSPQHYKKNWLWFISEHLTFPQGCVMKRLVRLGLKDKPLFDLYKIKHELQFCDRHLEQQLSEQQKIALYGDFRAMIATPDYDGWYPNNWMLDDFIKAVLEDDFELFNHQIDREIRYEEQAEEVEI